VIIHYLKNRKREWQFFNANFNVALVVTLLSLVGTYFEVPPFNWILNFSESIKDSAAKAYGEPPYSHAELSTLKQFCETMQIDLDKAMGNLTARGIDFDDEHDVLKDIANRNHISPQRLYAYMQAGNAAKAKRIPDLPPPGTGKKTIRAFCEQYNLDTDAIIDYFAKQQIAISGDMTLKEIAEKQETNVITLYKMIKAFAGEKEASTGDKH
jgi:hypothetical protein